MVITQGCDIVKAADVMPQVEIARVFESTNPAVIAESQHYGSAHFYRLDKGTGVPATILDYGRRAHLDKGFLEALEPDNSILASWSVETRKTFARWLGRRYSRPAVPDEHYETITAPVVAMWRRLAVDDPARAAAYSAEYPEFRYRLDGDVLIVYVLSANAAPDETAWLELSGLIADALSPYHGTVEISSDRRSYHVFTKAEELASEQIDLDWASHDEGAVTGAIPG
jgi:hypothetical protein